MTTTPNPTAEQIIAQAALDADTALPDAPCPKDQAASIGKLAAERLRAVGLLVGDPIEEPTREQRMSLGGIIERALRQCGISVTYALSGPAELFDVAGIVLREYPRLAAAGVALQEPSKSENAAVARSIRLWTRQVRSELEATREANIPLGEQYLEGMDSALRQAEEHAARIENDLYGDAPAPQEPSEWDCSCTCSHLHHSECHEQCVPAPCSGREKLIAEAEAWLNSPTSTLAGARGAVRRLIDALAAPPALDPEKVAAYIGEKIIDKLSDSWTLNELAEQLCEAAKRGELT